MLKGVLIVGHGAAARAYARLIMRTPGLQCFFWSENTAVARILDRRLHSDGWFNSFASALADGRIQLVLLATGHDRLNDLAVAAVRAGKHVAVSPMRRPYTEM